MVLQDADLKKRAGLTSEDVKQVRLHYPNVSATATPVVLMKNDDDKSNTARVAIQAGVLTER